MPAPRLAEHFSTVEHQETALKFGMWCFLATEILLFAGLFVLYTAYRSMYGVDFAEAAGKNNIILGTVNTLVLLTSSLTAALCVWAVRASRIKLIPWLLGLTMLCGATFMVIKSFEYMAHFKEGIFPGLWYRGELHTFGANIFFNLYFVMTGLHALHVMGGMGVLLYLLVRSHRGRYSADNYVGLEMGTLYWHLIDVVWIFLWPLLYLTH